MSVNELTPELLGIHSLNFAAMTNSASRNVMMGGHNSQRIIIENPDPNRCPTGVELELGKYTFDVKIPKNSRILKILKRYPAGVDADSLDFNPETLIIYEEEDTRMIDFVSVSHHQSFHQTFGFRNKFTPEANNIRPNTSVRGGTVLAHSPGLGANGFYMYGKMMETAFMSVPGSAEDGFVVSKSGCEDLTYYAYETRRYNVGSRQFAMNINGDKDNYQAFPHIGQWIRPDGMLLCLRDYDVDISPVEMSIYDTMEPDMYFDEFLYTKAGPGRVVDIRVIGSHNPSGRMPALMSAQFQRYQKALVRFHREIVELEQKLRQEKRRQTGLAELNLSRKFHQLVVDSMAIINHRLPGEQGKYNLNLLYRKEPLDEFMIEFVVEYKVVPGIGHKLTGLAGDLTLLQ